MTEARTSRTETRGRTQDFAPVLVRDCELSRPIQPIDGQGLVAQHRTANVLVRLHDQPLGSVAIDLPGGVLDAAGVAEAIWAHLQRFDPGPPRGRRPPHRGPARTRRPRSCPVAPCTATRTQRRPARERRDPDPRPGGQPRPLPRIARRARLPEPRDHRRRQRADQRRHRAVRRAVRRQGVIYVREDRPGASAARNRGLVEASGAIVAFTDDDVLVDPHWIRALVDCFDRNPDVACVTGLVVPAELETPAQVWFERYGGFNKGYEAQLFDTRARTGGAAGCTRTPRAPSARATTWRSGRSCSSSIGGYDCALGPGHAGACGRGSRALRRGDHERPHARLRARGGGPPPSPGGVRRAGAAAARLRRRALGDADRAVAARVPPAGCASSCASRSGSGSC